MKNVDISLLKYCGGSDFFIECDKSILRPLNPDDLSQRYLGWLNDFKLNKYSRRRKQEFTFREICDYVVSANQSKDTLLLGIYVKDTDVHVGNVQLCFYDKYNGLAELGTLLGERDYWAKGIIVDVGKHLMHFGFQKLSIRKFIMGNYAPHRASTFKSTSLGAKQEGRRIKHAKIGDDYVDVLEFGLFAEDFYARFPELYSNFTSTC